MIKHAYVRHPKEVVQEAKNSRRRDNKLLYYNDIVLEWITNHVFASVILFEWPYVMNSSLPILGPTYRVRR